MIIDGVEMAIVYRAEEGIVYKDPAATERFSNVRWFAEKKKLERVDANRSCNRHRGSSRCGKLKFRGKCPLDKDSNAKCRCASDKRVID